MPIRKINVHVKGSNFISFADSDPSKTSTISTMQSSLMVWQAMTFWVTASYQEVNKALRACDTQKGEAVSTVSKKQEAWGVSVFSLLFLLWGLAYGLLDIMNYHIKVKMGISRMDGSLLAMAYYFAYPSVLFLAGPLVTQAGYRFTAFIGVLLLGGGDFLMAFGAQRLSFPIMCISHFVVGLGVSTLERAANAYVVELGPRHRAQVRILFGQTWAAIGTVIAPQLANVAIFDNSGDKLPQPNPNNPGRCLMPPPPPPGSGGDLDTIVSFYRYLGAGIFGIAIFLGLVFFRTKLVVEAVVPESPASKHRKIRFWKHPLCSLRYARLWYAVVANFLNLGCQVAVAQFFIEHIRVNACASDKGASNWMTVAQGLFVVGRLAAFLLVSLPSWIQARWIHNIFRARLVLATFLGMAVLFTGAGIFSQGKVAVACACLVMFSEAPSFPMIFESASADLGEHTTSAETLMITSIMGGGLLPFLMGTLTDAFGVSLSWSLVTGCFAVTLSYCVMCNIVPSFREALDNAHNKDDQSKSGGVLEMSNES